MNISVHTGAVSHITQFILNVHPWGCPWSSEVGWLSPANDSTWAVDPYSKLLMYKSQHVRGSWCHLHWLCTVLHPCPLCHSKPSPQTKDQLQFPISIFRARFRTLLLPHEETLMQRPVLVILHSLCECVCVWVCAHARMFLVFVWCPQWPEESTGSYECGFTHGCCKPNSGA